MNNKNNMIINNNDDNKSIVTKRQTPQVNNTIQNRSALSTISYPTTITNQANNTILTTHHRQKEYQS